MSRKLEDTTNTFKRACLLLVRKRGNPRPRILGPNVKQADVWCGFEQVVDPREENGIIAQDSALL